MPSQKKTRLLGSCCAGVTIPELVQSKAAVLSTLASTHSRRSYKHAIERFIHWYCSEPRLGFNRSVVVRYRAFLGGNLGTFSSFPNLTTCIAPLPQLRHGLHTVTR
jgi:hypothetical protein